MKDGKRSCHRRKLNKELKRKFLPNNNRQDVYLKLYNCKQKELFMGDYTIEFNNLMMNCDLVEVEENMIARYIRGPKHEISNLQSYTHIKFILMCIDLL